MYVYEYMCNVHNCFCFSAETSRAFGGNWTPNIESVNCWLKSTKPFFKDLILMSVNVRMYIEFVKYSLMMCWWGMNHFEWYFVFYFNRPFVIFCRSKINKKKIIKITMKSQLYSLWLKLINKSTRKVVSFSRKARKGI